MMGNSTLWTNSQPHNAENKLKSFYEGEAKFPAFNKMPFDDICIGMNVSNDLRWLPIPGMRKESLLSVFKDDVELLTNKDRSAWKGLIASPSLQTNCNKEGFNLKDGDSPEIMVRIGYIGNNENDCKTCDSLIGIGPASRIPISCGNYARAAPDNGEKRPQECAFYLLSSRLPSCRYA